MILIKSIIIIIIIFYINYRVHVNGKKYYYDKYILNNIKIPKIYDIGHKFLPDLSSYANKIELILGIMLLLPIIFILLNKNKQLSTEFLSFWLVLLSLRALCVFITILPKNENCNDSYFNITNLINGHCYDKIFSGHTATAFLIVLLLYKYGFVKNIFLITMYLLFTSILLLISRGHYTIDIIMAFIITYSVFKLNFRII